MSEVQEWLRHIERVMQSRSSNLMMISNKNWRAYQSEIAPNCLTLQEAGERAMSSWRQVDPSKGRP